MALRKRRIGFIAGLADALNGKVAYSDLKATMSDVVAANNGTTAPSTKAVVELKTSLEASISSLQTRLGGIIDDAAETGSDVTWSIDQIKNFVSSVDDSVVVGDLSERDALTPYDSLIAYVLDTTGDSSLGDNEGTAAAYIYVDGQGWKLLQILNTDIDLTPYVKKSDIVNDLVTGGSQAPLSAEQGKVLKGMIDAQSSALATELFVDSGLAISSDKFTVTSTPLGNVVGAAAEIDNGDGTFDTVDVTPTANAGEFQIVGASGAYDGKTARVTYLRHTA